MPKLELDFFVNGEEIKEKETKGPVIATFSDKGEYYDFKDKDGKEKRGFKIALKFPDEEDIKMWSPNNTSLRTLEKVYGDNTDEWEGKKVELYTIFQKVFGEDKNVVYARIPKES